MKRALKIVLGLVAGLVVLVVLAFVAAAMFLDLDKVVNAQIAQHKPEIEQKLGRKVEVGPVTTTLFPTLSAKVQNVTIAADPNHKEDDRPLLQLGSVGFEVGLWDALVSRGKDLKVKTVYLDGLKVNVVRYPDGTLSYQDILDRQPKDTEPQPPSQPMSEDTKQHIRDASIGEVRLGDAEIRFVDHDTPTHAVAEEFIKHFNIDIQDIRIADPIKIHVDAAIFAEAKNFDFDTVVGPLPADLQLDGTPPIGATALKMTGVALERITPYLGKAVPARIDSALADADLKISGYGAAQPKTRVDGFVDVKNIRIAGGDAFEFRLDSALEVDTQALGVDISKLELALGQIHVSASGGLSNLATKPQFKNFKVHTDTLAPGLIYSYYPPAKANLPAGYKLDGPVKLDVTASGDAAKQTVVADVDLANLDVLIPGSLAKPKGTAMGLKVDGDFTATDATLRKAEVILDELDLVAQGTVKNFSAPTMDIKLSAKPFSFDRIARLSPALRDALTQQHATAQGQGRIDGHVQGTQTNLDAALDVALTGVKLAVPGTTLDGNLTLHAAAKGDPQTNLVADVSLDGQQATIVIPNTVDKAASTPMLLTAHVVRAGQSIDVKQFDVRFAELSLHADGSFDQAKGETALNVNVAPLDLEKFARTVTAIPAAKAKGGVVDVKVAVKGNPNKLETLSVDIDPLNVRYGGSDLKGQMSVTNLVKPNATMKITSSRLDLDTLLGLDDSQKKADKTEKDDPTLKDITFAGNFDAKTMIYSQVEMTNFKGVVHLQNGVLTIDDAGFNVFGGSVSAKGTTAEIWKGKMPFHAKLAVKGIDVNQALTAKTKYGGLLQGRGDFNVDLSGAGFESAELEQALTGNLDTSLTQAKYNAGNLTQSVLGGFATTLSKVPGMKLLPSGDNAINDLAAAFTVNQGKMQLKKPLGATVDGSKVTLDGAIGIAGGLFLTGTYGLSGRVLTAATGGKCKVNGDVPIPVKIGGTVSKPTFAPDVAAAGQNVLTACLTGQAGEMAKQAVDNAKAQAEAAAKAAAAQAQAQAQAAAANAKAQADAQAAQAKAVAQAKADAEKKAAADAAAKAKADADKKAKDAADAAKKKASDALGGIHF